MVKQAKQEALIDTKDIIVIRTMLSKLNLNAKEDKEALIEQYSHNRTKSTKELLKSEATELIYHLRRSLSTGSKAQEYANRDRGQKMKNKIFSMAHEMGWHIQGTRKLDMVRLNAWMEKSSIEHKKIDQYRYEELPALVTQFEAVYVSFLKTVK